LDHEHVVLNGSGALKVTADAIARAHRRWQHRHQVRVLTAMLAALLAVVAANPARAGSKQAPCGKLLAPASGIYFGSAPDFVSDPKRLGGDTVTAAAIEQFEQAAGRKPVLAEFDQHWFEGLQFPRDKVMTVWRSGQIPFVRMEPHSGSPYGQGNPPEQYPGDYSLQNIIDGKFDTPLRAWADAARDTDIPILMEFGIEENNSFGPWAGDWNGAGQTNGYGDPSLPDGPERFRDAYRHLVTLFRDEGATNVTWFFHVDTWYSPRLPWDTYANYYRAMTTSTGARCRSTAGKALGRTTASRASSRGCKRSMRPTIQAATPTSRPSARNRWHSSRRQHHPEQTRNAQIGSAACSRRSRRAATHGSRK
jgi:hypothetical protein